LLQTLTALFVTILFGYLFGELSKLIKVPRVVGYLTAGIILNLPSINSYMFSNESLNLINLLADLGIILFFFFIGLEINLKDFKINLKESSLVSIFNTFTPLIIGFLISYYSFGFDFIVSFIIGLALSVSSQLISLDILDEYKIIKTKVGKLIITSGAVADIFQLLLITLILALINSGDIYNSLLKSAGNILIFIVALILARIAIFPIIFRIFEGRTTTSLFSGSLIVAFLTALLSDFLGLGVFVGALFAGVVIRHMLLTGKHKRPWEEHSITHSIHIVAFGLFVPLFFISVGLNFDLNLIFKNINLSLMFVLIGLLGGVVGSIIGVLLSKGSFNEGLIVGFGVSPKGDTELVLATIALTAGLFDQTIFSSIIFMALITTLISPIMFRILIRKYHHYLNLKN